MFIDQTTLVIPTKDRVLKLKRFFYSLGEYVNLFNEIISALIKNDLKIDRNLIITCLEKKGLSGSTPARRFSTIKAWINWIKNEL